MDGFLDIGHVFILVHIVLDICSLGLGMLRLGAFCSKMSGIVTVIALLDALGSRSFFYLCYISSKAGLSLSSVWGELASRQVHGYWKVI